MDFFEAIFFEAIFFEDDMGERNLKSSLWQSRILGEELVDPSSINPHPHNWRVHGDGQQRVLSGLLEEVGWVAPVIVNRRTERLVDGHLRVEMAIAHKEPTIPVLYVDLSEEEEALVLASLDPVGALATADLGALAELRALVDTDNADILSFLATLGDTEASAFPQDMNQPTLVDLPSRDEKWGIILSCDSELHQKELLTRLTNEGYTCRALIY
jgi:hypothetical protein